jgi:hypothetical protein
MARKHTEDEVLRALSLKKDCKVDRYDGEIKILTDKIWDKNIPDYIRNPHKSFDLGNGSWGSIDFLVNYLGYRIIYVGEF